MKKHFSIPTILRLMGRWRPLTKPWNIPSKGCWMPPNGCGLTSYLGSYRISELLVGVNKRNFFLHGLGSKGYEPGRSRSILSLSLTAQWNIQQWVEKVRARFPQWKEERFPNKFRYQWKWLGTTNLGQEKVISCKWPCLAKGIPLL